MPTMEGRWRVAADAEAACNREGSRPLQETAAGLGEGRRERDRGGEGGQLERR